MMWEGAGGGVGVGVGGGGGGGGGSTASSSPADRVVASNGGGSGSGSGRRKPSWRERENNKRRERRRRAIAAKIYTGLRAQGNYDLPKHCDNNEVLKALCAEAGWIVEPDGNTYRKGTKPIPSPMETGGTSANITPSSSRNPSPPSSYLATPIPSYQASPLSSACPSPTRYDPNINYTQSNPFGFLHDTLPSSLPSLRISNSAPATPPFSSPTSRLPPRPVFNLDYLARESMFALNFPFASAPTSPIRGQRFTPTPIPECDESESSTIDSTQWMNFRDFPTNMVPNSPTFNLIKPVALRPPPGDSVSEKGTGVDFDLEKSPVKAWEGERIHEVGPDDLELTLGNSSARV